MKQPEYYVFTVSKDGLKQTKHTFVSVCAAAEAVVSSLHSCANVGFGSNGQGREWLKMVEELHEAITQLSAVSYSAKRPFEEPDLRNVMRGVL